MALSSMYLAEFNMMPESDANNILLQCCASKRWASELLSKRPFHAFKNLLEESAEQASVSNANQAVLHELELKNKLYFDKNGFIYLVYATGKTAVEMLRILNERMDNSVEKELEIAAAEQLKIAQQRLTKLIAAPK